MNNWRQYYDEAWGVRKYRKYYPAQPWHWKAEWNDPLGIPPQDSSWVRKCCAIGGAIFCGVAILAVAGLIAAEHGAIPDIPGNSLYLGASGAIAAGLFYFAWRTPSASEQKSSPRFIPVATPLPLRGEVAGMLVVPRPISPNAPSRIYLYCQRRELIEVERGDSEREQRFKERVEKIFDGPECLIRPEEWQPARGGVQAVVQIPVDGTYSSTTSALEPKHPVIEWRVRCDIPAAEGALHFEFLLPLFGASDASDTRSSRLAEALADPDVQRAIPTVAPPIAASDREEIFRSAGIVPTPHAGAVGHTALCMDPKAARAAASLVWIGYPVAIFFTIVVTFALLWVPLLGWLAALALILCTGYWIITDAYRMLRRRKGPETIWVERGELCVADADSRELRIPRAEIDRIEVVPIGNLGKDRFLKLIAAGPTAPDSPIRARQTVIGAIRTREAAHAVGQWLSERLGEPHPKVMNTEEGWALVEKFTAWMDRNKQ